MKTPGGRRESKRFFFEKKKQKTFMSLGLGRQNPRGPDSQKFFAALFFKKARTFSSAFRLPRPPRLV
jgi:hypothetical protein